MVRGTVDTLLVRDSGDSEMTLLVRGTVETLFVRGTVETLLVRGTVGTLLVRWSV